MLLLLAPFVVIESVLIVIIIGSDQNWNGIIKNMVDSYFTLVFQEK